MNTCLRSKRPEVRILSGVPLPSFQNQSLAPIMAHATPDTDSGFGPIVRPVSVQLHSSCKAAMPHRDGR